MPSLLIALAAVAGFAVGRVARLAVPTSRTPIAIFMMIAIGLAILLVLATRSPYALLPPAGLLVGALYRKPELISLGL